jgi:hypothetical protein
MEQRKRNLDSTDDRCGEIYKIRKVAQEHNKGSLPVHPANLFL